MQLHFFDDKKINCIDDKKKLILNKVIQFL